jgi:RNA polymerase sigma-70 factor, ECF subfamily
VAAQIANIDRAVSPGVMVGVPSEGDPSTSGHGPAPRERGHPPAATPFQHPAGSERTLSELLVDVGGGDHGAFKRLYDRSSVAAYSLAFGVIRDRQLAADAVQEAFIAVWKNAHSFDPAKGNGRTWILVIAHRKSVDLIRRNSRHRPREYQDSEAASDTGLVEQSSLEAETRTQVQEILAALPPAHRQVIDLAYFGGYTQSELAVKLSLPIGTIKSRTHAALTALRVAAEESGLTIHDTL